MHGAPGVVPADDSPVGSTLIAPPIFPMNAETFADEILAYLTKLEEHLLDVPTEDEARELRREHLAAFLLSKLPAQHKKG